MPTTSHRLLIVVIAPPLDQVTGLQVSGTWEVPPRFPHSPSLLRESLQVCLTGLLSKEGRDAPVKVKQALAQGLLKKKKIVTWSHTYICLSHPYDDMAPGSSDRATLKLAGLGEKRFHVNVASTAQEFRDEHHQEYPKLMDGGGFELLRVMEGGGKGLEVIQIPETGYTPEYLKAVIHHAKIFIRPLQKALDVQPQNTAVSYN